MRLIQEEIDALPDSIVSLEITAYDSAEYDDIYRLIYTMPAAVQVDGLVDDWRSWGFFNVVQS